MTEQQADASQADAEVQSQADDAAGVDQSANDATPADAPDKPDKPDTISLEEAKKLRSEASNLRKRLKDAEGKVQSFEDAQKTESEKAADRLKAAEDRAQELEQRYRETSARVAFMEAASAAGSQKPGWLYRAVKDDIQFDEDGNPVNIDEVIAAAKTEAPYEFRASGGSGDGGRGNDSGSRPQAEPSLNTLLRGMVSRE